MVRPISILSFEFSYFIGLDITKIFLSFGNDPYVIVYVCAKTNTYLTSKIFMIQTQKYLSDQKMCNRKFVDPFKINNFVC